MMTFIKYSCIMSMTIILIMMMTMIVVLLLYYYLLLLLLIITINYRRLSFSICCVISVADFRGGAVYPLNFATYTHICM